jgi:HEPN domain-containing protein/predicted nucleotidyltransferase
MVTLRDAKEVSDAIIKTLDPISVMVFGSVAKNGTGEDLDLLIVVEDKSENLQAMADLSLSAHKCLKEYYKKFAIDPFIIPASVFNQYYSKGSPFLRLIFTEGRCVYMRDAVKGWLKQAQEELDIATYLLGGQYFKGACFHSQQSIEKAVKAMLLDKGWELEKTHSLQRLLSIAEQHNVQIDLSDEDVVYIDNIYRSRYPAEAGLLPLGEPSKADAQRAVDIATRILNAARK